MDVMVAGWIRRGICDITLPKSSGEFGQKRENCILSYLIPPLLPPPPPPPADLFVGGPRRFRLAPFSHVSMNVRMKGGYFNEQEIRA